jgi:hypothetical protein
MQTEDQKMGAFSSSSNFSNADTHYKKIGLWQQNLFVAQKSQFRRLMY